MRTLLPVPDQAFDPSGFPRTGSFRGGLQRVDLSPLNRSLVRRTLHHKRWMYFAIASEEVYVAVCVVRLGYAASAFAFAFDRRSRRMLVDRSSMAPPFVCEVGDTAGEGCVASYHFGLARVGIARNAGSTTYGIDASFPGMKLRARLDGAQAPPSLTAIARLPGRLLNTTEKRTLLAASGELIVGRERRSLDRGLAGYDYTNGMLARHTAWRWGFALGRAKSGERVGLNLVQGFVGEPECGVWIDDEVFPLAEGRFVFDAKDPLANWRVTTPDGAVDLSFLPGGMHAEKKNLGIVATRFVQPVGLFSGKIRAGGKELELDRVLGVTEDQDARW